jgi:hypothetical protein
MIESFIEVFSPVFEEMERLAAQKDIIQYDDTYIKIAEVMKLIREAEGRGERIERRGTYTTVIIGKNKKGSEKITLYYTGLAHGGENVENLLTLRDPSLPAPCRVCDGLKANTIGESIPEKNTAGCNDHSRRKFFEIKESYPECNFILSKYADIYRNDRKCKKDGLTDLKRLEYHKEKSEPIFIEMKDWCEKAFSEKRVEPNSNLGGAIKYFLKQYTRLTLFLREEGVPLSNCECEQALKIAITVRKNSPVYRTLKSARVADMIFSLIINCKNYGVNIFHYMVELQRNEKKVKINPEKWLPWSYHLQLEKVCF